jgi:transcriptional regulator with XRE-family HTH domain
MLDARTKEGQETVAYRERRVGAPRRHATSLGQHLRKWRTVLGLTLDDVAVKIGRYFTAVQKWELGINKVSMKELELLGAAYGVPAIALTLDPVDRAHVDRLIRANRILENAPGDVADAWLLYGERKLRRPRKPPAR